MLKRFGCLSAIVQTSNEEGWVPAAFLETLYLRYMLVKACGTWPIGTWLTLKDHPENDDVWQYVSIQRSAETEGDGRRQKETEGDGRRRKEPKTSPGPRPAQDQTMTSPRRTNPRRISPEPWFWKQKRPLYLSF